MTAKDYFRIFTLHNLDIEINPLIIELDIYLTNRLSNLKWYNSKNCRFYYKKFIYRNFFCYDLNMDHINIHFLYNHKLKSLRKKLNMDFFEFEKIIKIYISKICHVDSETIGSYHTVF